MMALKILLYFLYIKVDLLMLIALFVYFLFLDSNRTCFSTIVLSKRSLKKDLHTDV